ncbi:MAG: helix-turn-helix transcriptional regulator [Cytophagales bacterium]|nr:helix-turn-helix transcriptional regulator [Cytophagales bacterium]
MVIEHKVFELYGKKAFELAVVTPPFKHFNPLPNEACYLHIFEGVNDSYSEDDRFSVAQNEGVLMKCGNYFYDLKPNSKSGTSGLIAVHFHPDVLKKIYEKELPSFLQNEDNTGSDKNMTLIHADELIHRFMEDMQFLFAHRELVNEELLMLRFREIIVLLLKSKASGQVHQIMSNLFSPKEFDFRQVIETHIFSPLTVNDLAELTNHSLASFKRTFRNVFDDSPANYIKNRRLDHAAELLAKTTEQISHIALDCQFNDLAHFSNSFKSRFNVSPKSYRLGQSRN